MRRVLIVDDEPMILEVAQVSLETIAGWTVLTAGDGAEAVRVAAVQQPDAILMDVMMPGMDGPATCRHLAENAETSTIPIILLTAKVQRADQRQWESLPVAGVLGKPFDPVALPSQMADLLGWTL